jgi:hypothetical protein
MRRIIAFALVLLPALPVFAGGRTFKLPSAEYSFIRLKPGEKTVTLRAKPNTKLSRNWGNGTLYTKMKGKLSADGTHRLFKIDQADYITADGTRLSVRE